MAWPQTGLIWRVDHAKRCITLLNPEMLQVESQAANFDIWERTVATFNAIQWLVKMGEKK